MTGIDERSRISTGPNSDEMLEQSALLSDELGRLARGRGVSFAALARATGYSPTTIRRKLSGGPVRISLPELVRISLALDAEPSEVLGRALVDA